MNKRLFLKMSLATLPVLALFSQPVLAEENIHFLAVRKLGKWILGYSRGRTGIFCQVRSRS